jgi:hypothetical protein
MSTPVLADTAQVDIQKCSIRMLPPLALVTECTVLF